MPGLDHVREPTNHTGNQVPLLYDEDTSMDDEYPTYSQDSQEYMHWHYKLNHPTHKVMIKMGRQGMLPRRITKILNTMETQQAKQPMCNDCCGAKATRKPWRDKGDKARKGHLRKATKPGEIVSVDQLESSVPGFIGQMTGRLTNKRIVASTIFVDHASDLSYVYHQTSTSSEETLKSKLAFEKFAASHGVSIKHYHADNGRFKDNLFMNSIEEKGQTISFSGVGAHHQNGIAEKRIGDLQRRATTILLHAQRRWPDTINTHLWTYAIRAANDSRNYSPTNEHDICPMSRFCSSSSVPTIQNQHHFGCPTYVLKKELQDHKKIRKWTDRTRVGINLGYSSRHALNVSLILNLQTGLVSPQYHCQYDDLFETTTGTQARSIPTSQWQYKAGLVEEKPDLSEEEQMLEDQGEEQSLEDYFSTQESEEENTDVEEEVAEDTGDPDIYITRSGRKSKAPEWLTYDAQSCLIRPRVQEQEEAWIEQDLLAFKASTDPDTMYHHQAMKQPDREKFQEAMKKECEAHFKEGNYKLIKKSKLPEGATLLSSVWQMKRKRKPSTGEISKYKARMNVDGSQMIKGLHY
jgi:transposase InsO family protein